MAAGLLGLLGLRATGAATFATATTTPQGALSTTRTLRLRGCDGHSGIRAPLRSNAALNAAAAQWSRGGKLKAAIERSGYREDQSAGLHLSGTAQALSDALAQHLCAALTRLRRRVGRFSGAWGWLTANSKMPLTSSGWPSRMAGRKRQSAISCKARSVHSRLLVSNV